MLWGAVTGRAKQLTAAATRDDIASYADAAAALDLEHQLKPSSYFTKYLKRKGNKVTAESDSSSGQAAEAAAGSNRRKRVTQQQAVEEEEERQLPRARGRGGKKHKGNIAPSGRGGKKLKGS